MNRRSPRGRTAEAGSEGRRQFLRRAGAGTAVALSAVGFASGSGVSRDDRNLEGGESDYEDRDWELVWRDEFDDGAIDTETWSFEIGNGHDQGIPGWGNEELQYYTDEAANAFVEDDRLVIRAREERRADEHGSYDYTSARVITQEAVTVRHGRIDIRARLPEGQGLWPALWMLGADIDDVGWPDCGEIDIVELTGDDPTTVHGTVHGPGYEAGDSIGGSYELSSGTFADSFHVFSIVWDPDRISWYVDGEPYFAVTRTDVEDERGAEWVFDGPFFFVLNVAVGGHLPGDPDETTTFPQRMDVDYVRVYEEAGEPSGPPPIAGAEPQDTTGDGLYNDLTGNGQTTHDDVRVLLEHIDDDAVRNNPEYFDFADTGRVGFRDVVELLRRV